MPHKRIEYQREWRRKNRELHLAQIRKYRKKVQNDPVWIMKKNAHQAVYRAIKRGEMKKLPCEVCGAENTHGHHDDYDKPLEVVWLCPQHHKDRHNE